MILRVFTLLIAFSSASFASNNPFVDKFGGPYTSADVEFRKDMMRWDEAKKQIEHRVR